MYDVSFQENAGMLYVKLNVIVKTSVWVVVVRVPYGSFIYRALRDDSRSFLHCFVYTSHHF